MNPKRRVRLFQVDAFTTQLFAGNPAVVVLDAECLDDSQMQCIAREFKGVDTAFVLPPETAEHDLRVRFFTPRGETGFVGHATIAVHAVLEALGSFGGTTLKEHRRQQQRGGVIQIERVGHPAGTRFFFSQLPPPAQETLSGERLRALCEPLGLELQDLDPDCPAVIAGVGGSRALLAVRHGDVLARLQPNPLQLAARSAAGDPPGYFVYTLVPTLANCDTEARMFCPAIGINEDPVSGNAHALLAMHLHALGRVPQHTNRLGFVGRQGHHMGRPGTLEIVIDATSSGSGSAPAPVRAVSVGGRARIVFESTLDLD